MVEKLQVDSLMAEAQDRLDEGEPAAAEILYRQVIEADPDNVEAWNKLGVSLARQKDMEGARECFEQALSLDSRHVAAISNMGNIHFDQGEYDSAVECYQRAINLDPDYHIAHNNLAAAYKKQGKFGEFVSTMKKAQKLQISVPPEPSSRGESGPPRRRFGGCLGMGGMIVLTMLLLIWAILA